MIRCESGSFLSWILNCNHHWNSAGQCPEKQIYMGNDQIGVPPRHGENVCQPVMIRLSASETYPVNTTGLEHLNVWLSH
jgi:hypothetical protein